MIRPVASFLIAGMVLVSNVIAQQAQIDQAGMVTRVGDYFLGLEVVSDNIIRVIAAKDREALKKHGPSLLPRKSEGGFRSRFDANTHEVHLQTGKIHVVANLDSGQVTFIDTSGKILLNERSRLFTPAEVQGETAQHIQQTWQANEDESLYGLGQHQLGLADIKGYDIDLWQRNTVVVVPMLVSSRGYGILWDNPSFTRFGDTRAWEEIPPGNLIDGSGKPGGLTAGTFVPANPDQLRNPTTTPTLDRPAGGRGARGGGQTSSRWVGQILAPTTGDYQFQTCSNGGIKVWIDNKLLIDHWRQAWLTEYDQVKVHLQAGKTYPIRIESGGDQASTMKLRWKTPATSADTSLWSEVADGEDYYFIYGPSIDNVIAGYRKLTGAATMLPKWAFGLWQSRQRYETSQELMDVVDGFRGRGIPFDNIVQDWMYWPQSEWGSHKFDPQRFPDPQGWIKQIHEKHANLMISVWGKFYPDTENAKALAEKGYIYQPTLDANLKDWVGRGYPYTFYDAFNPGARKMFWDQVNSALFSKGVDAWWMDATEPDVVQPSPPTLELMKKYMGTTALGAASRVINAYALFNSQAVYEGQRQASPNQRVFILTRSGYAGQQRYGTVTWSGDITSTWTALARQIPAALGFSISGNPYWTMDIGGYTMESRFSAKTQTPENAEEWRELNARWFQFGTFCPILRVHGELQPREMWAFGGEQSEAYKTMLKFDRLRYAMLPYIYSIAGEVTQNSGTIMRPLVMDFPKDSIARELKDEYLFGPALLAAPVTTYKARSRSVYLPKDAKWYDFWTGKSVESGRSFDARAPYDSMPLFAKAGSIIPFGPDLQYTSEKPADPITLYVYGGANGSFTLYEDQGTTYDYEKGALAKIPFSWDDAKQTLTIGARSGSFPGMLTNRTFNVIFINQANAIGYAPDAKTMKSVQYSGNTIEVAP